MTSAAAGQKNYDRHPIRVEWGVIMLRFIANLLRVFGPRYRFSPIVSEYLERSGRIGKTDQIPAELIPLAARLWTRGWFNRQILDTARDWVLPYWATRQLDPKDCGFIGRALQPVLINGAYRNWTAVGNPESKYEAIVDPRGLVTPQPNGWEWSLDVWVEVDGQLFLPSRSADAEVTQQLHENLPLVQTRYEPKGLRTNQRVFGVEDADRADWVIAANTVENPRGEARTATLYLALRPFSPEGAAMVEKIELRTRNETSELWVNGELGAVIPTPSTFGTSTSARGDVYFQLGELNQIPTVSDPTGMATFVAAFRLELRPHTHQSITAVMPLSSKRASSDEAAKWTHPDALSKLERDFSKRWRTLLAQGMNIRVPDDAAQNAFDANKAHLLVLHDGDAITPGPFLYHEFWFRDAAYMLHALGQLGYHKQVKETLATIPKFIRKDGYLQSQDGEWDSNGQALWLLEQDARLSGDYELLHSMYWQMLNMAHWIDAARQKTKKRGEHSPERGLLPAGMSAEHLGPNDYYYWDDWWGLAGLRAAMFAAKTFNSPDDEKKLQANYDAFWNDVDASLKGAAERNHAEWMPAAPSRRADSAMVANLTAAYPLGLVTADDARITATIEELKKIAFVDGAFFHHVGHGGFGTYLALHLAGTQLFQRNPEAWQAMRFVLANASPTWTWGETIHPQTKRGGHGDGHHGWVAADVVSFVRNALLFEERDHLVLTPALPDEWVFETASVKVERAATLFGQVSFTLAFGDHNVTLVLDGKWRMPPAYIEWNLPVEILDAGGEGKGVERVNAHQIRFPATVSRVVATF